MNKTNDIKDVHFCRTIAATGSGTGPVGQMRFATTRNSSELMAACPNPSPQITGARGEECLVGVVILRNAAQNGARAPTYFPIATTL